MSVAALRAGAELALRRRRQEGDRYSWRRHARPSQVAPTGSWRTWLILAGRGFGKTRTAVEWLREQVEQHGRRRVAIVAATAADVRDVLVEGESGILATAPPWNRPIYEPSKRRLTWPNGAIATTFSAEEPDRLRGPQHDAAIADELAAWHYPEAWDMLMFGLRIGNDPRVVVATTPRPTRIIRELVAADTTVLTRGSTYENRDNLAPGFLADIVRKYEGTRLGRQELDAEILDDVPGALWVRAAFDDHRVAEAPELVRVVGAVDPAVTANEDSDETGIVFAGKGVDGRAYVLGDLSCRLSPAGWGRRAIDGMARFEADRLIAEVNNGGDLVKATLRTIDPVVPFTAVRASRGKAKRAEPVAALYEQGKVSHVGTSRDQVEGWAKLEDQLCAITPDGYLGDASPDRADALVWALTALMLGDSKTEGWVLF